jgi:hypothetical protein
MEEKYRMKVGRGEVLDTRTSGDLGLDIPETGGDGNSVGKVDVEIRKI